MRLSDDAEVLFPERTVMIRGARVTVHEFPYLDGMHLSSEMPELLRAVAAHLRPCTDGDIPDQDLTLAVFDAYPDATYRLLACATRRDESWVRGLSHDERRYVLLTVWLVNQDFFFRLPADPRETSIRRAASVSAPSLPR